MPQHHAAFNGFYNLGVFTGSALSVSTSGMFYVVSCHVAINATMSRQRETKNVNVGVVSCCNTVARNA
eukprot:9350468-Lingulodinium_polyedra.AAC.1